jgi:hypothetical protein
MNHQYLIYLILNRNKQPSSSFSEIGFFSFLNFGGGGKFHQMVKTIIRELALAFGVAERAKGFVVSCAGSIRSFLHLLKSPQLNRLANPSFLGEAGPVSPATSCPSRRGWARGRRRKGRGGKRGTKTAFVFTLQPHIVGEGEGTALLQPKRAVLCHGNLI